MNLLQLAEQHVPMRKVGREWHGPCPHCGSGGDPLKSDRFTVKEDDRYFCRTCTPEGGDAISFLRTFEDKSCPEAHALLGKECQSTSCLVLDKCSKGKGRGDAPRRRSEQRLTASEKKSGPEWMPAEARVPYEQWQENARRLVEWAHQRLLQEPEHLAYLEGRGLPRAAVEKNMLGYWPETKFRNLSEWGLPEETNPKNGKKKKVWIPRGIVIPTFRDGRVDRIRIRRHADDLDDGFGKYVALKGSGDEVSIIGADRKAFVVVEGDLDGLLIAHHAGDLVGAVPLGSCSPRPRSDAYQVLSTALTILVALDFEPRTNNTTGRHENPGGQNARWWQKHFPNAVRWPVPVGKDPGEAFELGTDLRAWVLAGLPPAFHVQGAVAEKRAAQPAPETVPATPHPVHGTSRSGRPYILVYTRRQQRQMIEQHPGVAVVGSSEVQRIHPEVADQVLMVKEIFPGAEVIA